MPSPDISPLACPNRRGWHLEAPFAVIPHETHESESRDGPWRGTPTSKAIKVTLTDAVARSSNLIPMANHSGGFSLETTCPLVPTPTRRVRISSLPYYARPVPCPRHHHPPHGTTYL